MESIRELQEQLLPESAKAPEDPGGRLVLVFRPYKFNRQLSVELYRAGITREGKLKNPLQLLSPLELVPATTSAEGLRFLASLAGFQNNATSTRTATDIGALQCILQNPLELEAYDHDPSISESVVAAALQPMTIGKPPENLELLVHKSDDHYDIHVQVTIGGRAFDLRELTLKYELFLVQGKTYHPIDDGHYIKIIRFFKKHRSSYRVHHSRYAELHLQLLSKLEDRIRIHYTYMKAATKTQLANYGLDRIIYLSDHGNFVQIEPVMCYGDVEVPVLSKRQVYSTNEFGDTYSVPRNEEAEINFTALLLKQHPDFAGQLDDDPRSFYLHKDRFLDEAWFLNAFAEWRAQGIGVLGFNSIKGNKLNSHKANINIRVTSGINWFQTDISVRFGKKQASLKQLQRSVRNKSKFIPLDDGTMGILPEEWIEKLSGFFDSGEVVDDQLITPKINFAQLEDLYDPDQLDEQVQKELESFRAHFENGVAIKEVAVPEGLQATLRDYQRHGLNWLNFLDDHGFGGCLADDMGLGKTLQVIAFILSQREKVNTNNNLVVVPTSLIFNWEAEVKKMAPSIKMLTLYGAGREREMHTLAHYELVLTSYGTLLQDIGFLKHHSFNYIFLDESQHIRNIDSQRYEAVRQLKARNRIAITGTPVENNTLDLYAQLSFACPGLLGSRQHFRDLYSIPIDKFRSSRNIQALQKKVAPFILRRTKKEVAPELPEKTEMVLYCPMEPAQQQVYDTYEKELRDFISGKTKEELENNSMHILKGLTRLRQICNSPRLLEDEKLYSDRSSKIDMLLEQLENKTRQHKVLVFSQFVSMLHLIRQELDARGISYAYLDGSTRDREAAVRQFQENEETRVFLISLKAGGTGLNLTEADYVYLVDPWWNPAVEDQAIDRCYRIGQQKKVVAVRLICPGTLEEKIRTLQASKKELSGELVRDDASMLSGVLDLLDRE